MPQIKQNVPVVGGAWPALKADVLAVAKLHPQDAAGIIKACGPRTVTSYNRRGEVVKMKKATTDATLEHALELLVDIATDPNSFNVKATIPPDYLFRCFAIAPDMTLAVLTAARRIWFRGASKARKLYRWLSASPGWSEQDGETALRFERSPGGFSVSIADVKKARETLHRDILRGMNPKERTAYKRRHGLK